MSLHHAIRAFCVNVQSITRRGPSAIVLSRQQIDLLMWEQGVMFNGVYDGLVLHTGAGDVRIILKEDKE